MSSCKMFELGQKDDKEPCQDSEKSIPGSGKSKDKSG